jgi:3-oxoacyl-[acyl-carrier-protein] synthase-1
MNVNLAVTGVGILGPVGLTASVAMHSVRTGISRLSVQPFPDRAKSWIVGSRIPAWVPYLRARRLEAFASRAFAQAWQQATLGQVRGRVSQPAIVLGAPEAIRPGYKFPTSEAVSRRWANGLGIGSVGPCEIVAAGACSAQRALQRAAQLIQSGAARVCAIGVADTQLHIRVTRWHEDNYRLKCSYLTDGLMPGEAACFLIVENESAATSRGARVLAQIVSTEVQTECATILSDNPNTAMGLTTAVRTALGEAGTIAPEVGFVWSDLNGESYRAREWAFVEVRLGFQTHTELFHPADCHGDVGAATDALLLGLAVQAQATGWARGKPALVFSGSEGGIRAATIVAPSSSSSSAVAAGTLTEKLPAVISTSIVLVPLAPDDANYAEAEDPLTAYFEWQLRQEHADSLAGLYYQRKCLLSDGTVPWIRAREPEQRMLNHVDAAVAGGENSMWAMASGVKSDDEGACFAGALLIAALPNERNFAQLDAVVDDSATTNIAGIEAGLKLAPASQILQTKVDGWLGHPKSEVQAMAASIAGYRGVGDAGKLMELLHSSSPKVIAAAATALGRMRYGYALLILERLFSHPAEIVQEAAILAALLLGSETAEAHCRRLCEQQQTGRGRPAFYLALRGRLNDVTLFDPAGMRAVGDPQRIEAAGILGNIQAVPFLLRMLTIEDEITKKAAADALNLITGANLREKVKVIEKIDLLGGEFDEIQREVEQITLSPRAWERWWFDHRAGFSPNRRWRRGRPLDVGGCLAELNDPASRFHARQRAGWELAILARPNIRFEPDWFVAQQQSALAAWQTWWAANSRSH